MGFILKGNKRYCVHTGASNRYIVPENYYRICGESNGNSVYITINGDSDVVPVENGEWEYFFKPLITSISFENDTNLTSVDFTGCDLKNFTISTDTFKNCSSLSEIILSSDSWKPDIDLSSTALSYSGMSDVIDGLYEYDSGTHTVTFDDTVWYALTVVQRQALYDAADAKGWTTNDVYKTYYIRGTSSNTGGTETLSFGYKDDTTGATTSVNESVSVDNEGIWNFSYTQKKITAIRINSTTVLSVDFSDADDFNLVTSLRDTFSGCTALVTVDLSNATFNALINAKNMFYNCTSLTTVDFSSATFASATNVGSMFRGCTSLETLDLSSATLGFVTDSSYMFDGCSALESVDLSSATFASVTNASYMFAADSSLEEVDLSSATFASVTNANYMFQNCTSLLSADLSTATFTELVNAQYVFSGCTALEDVDMSSATLAKVTTTNLMFYNCTSLLSVDLSSATFAALTTPTGMFRSCTKLTTIALKSGVTFANVTTTAGMFQKCESLTTLDLSSATFASCTRTGNTNLGMFMQCGLPTINLPLATFGEVTDSQFMFYNAKSTAINMPVATFAKTTTTFRMFQGMTNITSISLPAATFESATASNVMFEGCTSLTQISLPEATFESTIHLSMFTNDSALQSISMPKATMESVTTAQNAFYACSALTTIDVPQNSTAIAPSTAPDVSLGASGSLTYTSMYKISNWLSDLTGYTARNITFKKAAWNALTSAEQTTIDGILTAKNWVRKAS